MKSRNKRDTPKRRSRARTTTPDELLSEEDGPLLTQADFDEALVMARKLRVFFEERAKRRLLTGGVFD